VSDIPEDTVTVLVGLPSSHDRDVAFNGMLHEECSTVELAGFSLSTFFDNGARLV
jgi:hypothetical protein